MKQCENTSPLTEIQKFSFLDFLIKKLYFSTFFDFIKIEGDLMFYNCLVQFCLFFFDTSA